ncbi:MAG: hypothetical protein IJK02_05565 [Clostridia bacterium]|nr:hypothetical protein [Clostridia bacterium]
MNKRPCMIAHRGYSSRYPQNTALAFSMAAKNGSGGAETDIRITADGAFVCSHDDDAVFRDGSRLLVADATLSELRAKPLKNPKTDDDVFLCTLEEYLTVMKENGMICFIELKGEFPDEKVREMFGICAQIYDLSKVIMQSFSFENLLKAHEMFPELPLMLTYGTNERHYERCFDCGFSIDCDQFVITPEMIREFHSRGLEVALWTVNTEEDMRRCLALGVDYIESDVYGADALTL